MALAILPFVFGTLAASIDVHAEGKDDSPAASGLFPPLQYPKKEDTVIGLRVSPGWARHAKMYGADFGLIGNITDNDFVGTAFAGGFNITSGNALILFTQMAGVTNTNLGKTNIVGIQLAFGYNYSASTTNVFGGQFSLIGNFGAKTNVYGIQFGLYNEAESVYGFQLGLVNRTKNLAGIQVGLLNYVEKGWLSFFPVINVGF